jgi:hypothetical protein
MALETESLLAVQLSWETEESPSSVSYCSTALYGEQTPEPSEAFNVIP